MGLLDDVTIMFGKGMNTVDKKTQTIRAQADLARVKQETEAALLELGRAVYQGEAENASFGAAYAAHIERLQALETQAAAFEARIVELNRSGEPAALSSPVAGVVAPETSGAPVDTCPSCGRSVFVSSPFCASCGASLAPVRKRYVRCPSCNEYYPADTVFCMSCGSRVEPLVEAGGTGGETSAASEPVVAEPVEAEPATAEPVESGPAVVEPVAAEPGASEPMASGRPVAEEPVAVEPAAEEPVAVTPVVSGPVASELPAAEEPAAVEGPVATEPVAVDSSPAETAPLRTSAELETPKAAHVADGGGSASEPVETPVQDPASVCPSPAEPEHAERRFCQQCGTPAAPGDLFCGVCGTRLAV